MRRSHRHAHFDDCMYQTHYTMGKKKGGKEAKAKGGGGGDGKLPPPPNLGSDREGALEALLSFKIRGKEEQINQYEEEAVVFKEKNYHHKERNYQLKKEQGVHYQTLVQDFQRQEAEEGQREGMGKESVEEALREKVLLAHRLSEELADLEGHILSLDLQLEADSAELEKWQTYKDEIQHDRATYISRMKQQMEEMKREEQELIVGLERRMDQARLETEEQKDALLEKHKELVSTRLVQSLDRDSREEMADNIWMHQQIEFLRDAFAKLQEEKDALEQRNLRLIESLQNRGAEEAATTRELKRSSMRKEHGGTSVGSASSGLPSLVDVSKCTADEGPGGRLGQLEMRLLSVQGSRAPLAPPPDPVHLPPIEQQRSLHSGLPQNTSGWPVTSAMLKSVM